MDEKEQAMFPPSVKSMYKPVPIKGKKYKKGRKFLPSLFDEQMLSPREVPMPSNSGDFNRPLFKNIDDRDGGYDTEGVQDTRGEALKFGFTAEDKFGCDSVQQNSNWGTGQERFQGSMFS